MTARRPLIALCSALAALGLAACGDKHSHLAGTPSQIHNVADANNDGGYVDAGPITYQLQVSRQLNPYSPEDSAYMRGLGSGTSVDTGPNQFWYGVFMWAKNQTSQPQTTSDKFEIVDTMGNVYHPVKLNTAYNPFAWTAQTLGPLGTEPAVDTPMSEDPTQGGLLLFKVSTDVYSNRPLTLYILGANDQRIGSISLDL